MTNADTTLIVGPNGDIEIRIWPDHDRGQVGYRVNELPPVYMDPDDALEQVQYMAGGANKMPDSDEKTVLSEVAATIADVKDQL